MFFADTATQHSYDISASEYAQKTANTTNAVQTEKFLKRLRSEAKILDIGCGAGRDALLFTELGVGVTGIDFSESMLTLAKTNAPLAEFHRMDIEEMDFPTESFDGAWANASLLHLSKEAFPNVLAQIWEILKEDGVFYLSLKKGQGEGMELDMRYGGIEKYYSYYQEQELQDLLKKAGFQVLEMSITEKSSPYQTHPFINIICKKTK